ncbi:MAG: hypothetical protein KF681_16380 [Bdellovibrionaceae bacterium]|nr:hypothetical protein [Pseudobdellovibrionaceae bacterium]
MKSTVINRGELEQIYFGCDNLKDLIAQVEAEFQKRGEVVCQIIINDMALHESDEVKLGATLMTDIAKVEVRSEKPSALLIDIVHNWELELPKMVTLSDNLAQGIRLKGPEGQYTSFVQLIDSCQFLIESLVSMDSIIDTELFLDRQVWMQNEKMMTEAVGQALSAFEKKDFAILADVLEYDIANALQAWFDLMKDLGGRLRAENDQDSQHLTDRIFKKSAGDHSVDNAGETGAR